MPGMMPPDQPQPQQPFPPNSRADLAQFTERLRQLEQLSQNILNESFTVELSFSPGDTRAVEHKLGRVPRGYLITRTEEATAAPVLLEIDKDVRLIYLQSLAAWSGSLTIF